MNPQIMTMRITSRDIIDGGSLEVSVKLNNT